MSIRVSTYICMIEITDDDSVDSVTMYYYNDYYNVDVTDGHEITYAHLS